VTNCIFCDVAKKKIDANIVYESNDICCLLDIDPINEGHMLIIPKQHFLDADEVPDSILAEIMLLSKKLIKVLKLKYPLDGYSVMQNGGVFNDVGHYHFHVFPRYKGDGFGWTYGDNKSKANEVIAQEIKDLLLFEV